MSNEKHCYLCGEDNFKKIHSHVRDNSDIDVLKCKHCSLVCLSSFEHIKKGFYETGGMLSGLDMQKWTSMTQNDDSRRFKFLKNKIKNKKVMDFGCGNGGFLRLAQKNCSKVVGVEIQQDVIEYCKKYNIKIYKDIEETEEKFDCITLFHVLEHIKDPMVLLQNLSKKLENNGKIVIEIPNSNDALLSLYKSKAFADFTYWSCHLYLFNIKTVSELVEKAGLKVKSVKGIQRYGISNHLWWLIKKKPGGHKKLHALNNKFINKIYESILAKLGATDTLAVTICK